MVDVVQNIFEFARQTPDAPAIVCDLEPVSYRAFYRMITAMRRKLAAHGFRPGGVVVVRIHSVLVSWIVNLASRALGLTTVSIRTPAEFEGFNGLDIVAIVTSASEHYAALDPAIAPAAARIVVERSDWAVEDDGGELEPPPEMAGDHILLTSGTTGHYKMMMVESQEHAATTRAGMDAYVENEGGREKRELSGLVNLLDLGLWTAVGYSTPLAMWTIGGGVVAHQGPDAYRSLEIPGLAGAMVTPGLLAQLLAAAPASLQRNDKLLVMVTGGPGTASV